MEQAIAREVGQATFEKDVIERSRTVPVVVDFWAPWCQPCLMLGPVLERLAQQADGAWELVKINTDNEPALARRYGIQGIPAVKGFRDGKVVQEFVGVLPERSIRDFLARTIPSRADHLVTEAGKRLDAGDPAGAESLFRQALEAQPGHPAAGLGLARLLLERGEESAARELLEALPARGEEGREADALLKRLQFVQEAATLPSGVQATNALATNPDDVPALWTLATRAAATGDYAKALSRFLQVIDLDRRYKDDGGRKAMLAIFTILGPDHELSLTFRPRLAAALH